MSAGPDDRRERAVRLLMEGCEIEAALKEKTNLQLADLVMSVWKDLPLCSPQSEILGEAMDRLSRFPGQLGCDWDGLGACDQCGGEHGRIL